MKSINVITLLISTLLVSHVALSKSIKTTAVPVSGKTKFKKEAIVMGGGCENKYQKQPYSEQSCSKDPKCDSDGKINLFKGQIETANKSLNDNGWKVDVLYADKNWEKNPKFNSKYFNKQNLIELLDSKTAEGVLNKGDELLIAVATHGTPGPDHSICYTDDDGIENNLSVESLKPYINKLTAKGVKVAWIEESCYSGSSVENFKDTKACVMTSANPNTEGIGDDVWRNFFGLGIEGGKVSSYVATEIFKARSDTSGDGKISASEAFHFGNIHMREPQFPRISECDLNLEDLGIKLKTYADFFKEDQKLYTSCESNPFASEIYQIQSMMTFPVRMQALSDLTKMKFTDDLSFEILNTKLTAYLRAIKEAKPDQIKDEKAKAVLAIKGLYYYACKVRLDKQPRSECSDFELFEKQSSPVF